jgi:hypothetical protein
VATIGHIKSTQIVDGQITAVVETGTGQTVTGIVMPASGSEFHPLPGDRVLFHWAGQEVHISAVVSEDASTGKGESLIFSRNAAGQVVASVHLRDNGEVVITTTGAVVGNGASPVALALPINTFLSSLVGAVSPGGSSILTPTPGSQCPVATAIRAASTAAFPPILSEPDCGSENLKAD